MKKIIAIGCFTALLMSCKKDHTCECTTGGTVVSTTTINDTKANAKAECDKGDFTLFGVTLACEIK